MTEQLRHHDSPEKLHVTDLSKENLERAKQAAEQAEAHGGQHSIEELRHKVHEHAVSGKEYSSSEREHTPATHTFGAHKQLKADGYKRTLAHIRSKLSPSEKALSKHVHNQKFERLDSAVAATVARPWGLLAGGLSAFVGSLIVLIMANHYGFRYNFGVFLVLFFGGYAAGSILELAARAVGKKTHRHHSYK